MQSYHTHCRRSADMDAPGEEEIKCPVCVETFTDPVRLPCGHNFWRDSPAAPTTGRWPSGRNPIG
uniref:Zinc finger RING-type eukaryotic domain-containing protein n=1 Tax=Cyprinus carpio TaxID=7962 RepID=A0A8C2KV65_CYPCA